MTLREALAEIAKLVATVEEHIKASKVKDEIIAGLVLEKNNLQSEINRLSTIITPSKPTYPIVTCGTAVVTADPKKIDFTPAVMGDTMIAPTTKIDDAHGSSITISGGDITLTSGGSISA